MIVLIGIFWINTSEKKRYLHLGIRNLVKPEKLKGLLGVNISISKTHAILMDGVTTAGKSTLIASIVNPSLKSEILRENIKPTESEYQVKDFLACTELPQKHITHYLRFFDMKGENSGSFIDSLDILKRQIVLGEMENKAILLIVWDISSLEIFGKSCRHFNEQRIRATYGSKEVSKIIKSIIVFFNKTDLVDYNAKDSVNTRIESGKQWLSSIFKTVFESGYEIHYVSGSAKNGNGTRECLGIILDELEISKYLPTVKGN